MQTSSQRPLSVTVIGWLFLIAGIVGLVYHASELHARGPFRYGLIWVLLVRFLAIVFAVFVLRGNNRARWLLAVWIAYHVVLSAFHSPSEAVVHALLLAIIVYFLFNARVSPYFRGARAQEPMREEEVGRPAG